MVIVSEGVNNEIEELKMNVGTTIEVRPEGQYGGFSKRGTTSYISENITMQGKSPPQKDSSQTLDQ